MMKRIAANAAALLLFFSFCSLAGAKDRLAVGYTSASGVFAGLWIAQEAKLFDKYNIDSHMVLIASGSLMVQSMLGGDLPISAAAGSASVDAALAGSDMTMFGTLVKVPAFYIMALPEIKSIEDLRGKSVGVTRFGSSTDFAMRYILKKQGLEPGKDVALLQTGDLFGAAAMLKTRAIVAAPFSSPLNLKAEEAGARTLMNMGKAGVYFPHDAFMARRAFLSANEDLVLRFIKAYSEAVYKLQNDPDGSKRAIKKYVRADDTKTLDAVYRYAVDYVDRIPYNSREGVQEVLNQTVARNPKAKGMAPESFYDDHFVKELDASGFYKQLWGK
ncbi:MAG TPA: ABC transporter substrate-binding protein [Candidatus Binatia bacterium]|jgi:ABC-type nitrate/sulfonate/bicarbonate transport system substrate-binding protein